MTSKPTLTETKLKGGYPGRRMLGISLLQLLSLLGGLGIVAWIVLTFLVA
ncbi:hypothetical protein IMZ29_04380 [Achromobacter sp. GG226]|nr:hypothetical protein [Verticiella sp. GG226]MBU4609808.1 hypothetical protein [Verticiella sp. GG226]